MAVRLEVRVKGAVEDRDALKRIRREISKLARQEMTEVAEDIAVPVARSLMPSRRVRANISAGATAKGAWVGIRRPRSTRFGGGARDWHAVPALLEYGGTITRTIRPNPSSGHRAVMTPYGPRAAVHAPRVIKGAHSIERAAKQTQRQVTAAITRRLSGQFERRGVDVDGAGT